MNESLRNTRSFVSVIMLKGKKGSEGEKKVIRKGTKERKRRRKGRTKERERRRTNDVEGGRYG